MRCAVYMYVCVERGPRAVCVFVDLWGVCVCVCVGVCGGVEYGLWEACGVTSRWPKLHN